MTVKIEIVKQVKRILFNRRFKKEGNIVTHLTIDEKIVLHKIAKGIVAEQPFAVEIGSYTGASACYIAAGLKREGKILCIDTWENDSMSEGKRNTLNEFISNTKKYEAKIVQIIGYSSDVINVVKNTTQEIDLLFIDGDHSFESCKRDWDLYSPMVRKSGYIVFHDSGWADGVKKVIEEHAEAYLTKTKSLPNMFWGIVKQ
jgi:predicted O-methyltransferase YrrM